MVNYSHMLANFYDLVPKEEEPPKVKEEEKSAKKLAVKTPNPKTKGGKTSAVSNALYHSIVRAS